MLHIRAAKGTRSSTWVLVQNNINIMCAEQTTRRGCSGLIVPGTRIFHGTKLILVTYDYPG